MTKPLIVTRSGWDRIRYAVIFEALLIVGFGVALALLSESNLLKTGALAVVLSLIAMACVIVYTFLFTLAYDRVYPIAQNG